MPLTTDPGYGAPSAYYMQQVAAQAQAHAASILTGSQYRDASGRQTAQPLAGAATGPHTQSVPGPTSLSRDRFGPRFLSQAVTGPETDSELQVHDRPAVELGAAPLDMTFQPPLRSTADAAAALLQQLQLNAGDPLTGECHVSYFVTIVVTGDDPQ